MPTHRPAKQPLQNHDVALLVEPTNSGKWQCRFEGAPQEDAIGDFISKETAIRFAQGNFANVRIIEPRTVAAAGLPALQPRDPQARLTSILSELAS